MPESFFCGSFRHGYQEGIIFFTASIDDVQFASLQGEVAKDNANKRLQHGFQITSGSREHHAFSMGVGRNLRRPQKSPKLRPQ